MSLAKALLTGKDVSKERLKARLAVCSSCDYRDETGNLIRCGICGCRVKDSGLINLARFEETKDYGCKFPGGSKWKENNC